MTCRLLKSSIRKYRLNPSEYRRPVKSLFSDPFKTKRNYPRYQTQGKKKHALSFGLMRSIQLPMIKMKISVFFKFTYLGISEFFLGGMIN